MSPRKINDRNSFKRKKDLFNFVDSLSLAMRSCKRCSSLEKTCILNETSKKCICCVKANKLYDLAISLIKFRRIHKKRLRVRDAIREMKTKLYRLKHQLRQLKNKKKEMMLSKLSVIDTLKSKEKTSLSKASKLSFDVFFEQFQFPNSLNWSPLVASSLDLCETSK
jgi:hypothetical protein